MEKRYVGEYLVNELPRILELKMRIIKASEESAVSPAHASYLKGRREMAEEILEFAMNVISKIDVTTDKLNLDLSDADFIEVKEPTKIVLPDGAVLRQMCENKAGDTFVMCEYGSQFVTWLCMDGGGMVYGHYFDSQQEAMDDLKIRAS